MFVLLWSGQEVGFPGSAVAARTDDSLGYGGSGDPREESEGEGVMVWRWECVRRSLCIYRRRVLTLPREG